MKVRYDTNVYGLNKEITKTRLYTPIGVFTGEARFNSETDPFPPSIIVGAEIAETRAEIKYIKALIRDKKAQLKGLRRAGVKNIIYDVILNEIKDLKEELKESYDHIAYWIKSREQYVRSRSVTKEEREDFKNLIKTSFEDLSKLNNGQK